MNGSQDIGAVPAARAGPWPSVTAVVATRDRPELLARAVASMMAQSYPGDLEVVVVFDQSEPADVPDGIAARPPGGRKLRVVTNSRTPGLAGARNAGITASNGDLVAFCDDDDTWRPGKLLLQVTELERTGAEFAGGGIAIHYSAAELVRMPPAQVSFALLARDRVSALHPSTFLIRRAVLEEIGLVDEEIPTSYGEDYDLLLRAARRMPVVSVAEPVADIYWHPQSYFAQRWQSIADALTYLLRKHPELTADPRGRARIEGQIAFAQAALARRPEAWRASWRALRGNPRERRAYLALAVAVGALSADSVVRMANRRGRGI